MTQLLSLLERQAGTLREVLPAGPWPLWLLLLAPLTCTVILGTGSRARGGIGRRSALGVSAASAVLALFAALVTGLGGRSLDHPWAPTLGLHLHLGVDHLSGPLVVAVCLATLVATVAIGRDDLDDRNGNEATQHCLVHALLVGALVVLLARDVVLLVLALSGVLLPVWALTFALGRGTREERRRAASRFAGMYSVGWSLVLAGTLVIVAAAGTAQLDDLRAGLVGAQRGDLLAGAVLVLLGGVLLVPLWPGHTWWPALAAQLRPAVASAVAGIVLPLGSYALLRILPVTGQLTTLAPWLGGLAVATMLWCGLLALAERDLARLHAQLIAMALALPVLALSTGSQQGLAAAALAVLTVSLTGTLLMAVLVPLASAWRGTHLDLLREPMRSTMPRLGMLILAASCVVLALPGSLTLWPLLGTVRALLEPAISYSRPVSFTLAGLLLAAWLLLAAAVMRLLTQAWAAGHAREPDPNRTVELPPLPRDASGPQRWAPLLLANLVLAAGLLPVPLLRTATHAALEILGVR